MWSFKEPGLFGETYLQYNMNLGDTVQSLKTLATLALITSHNQWPLLSQWASLWVRHGLIAPSSVIRPLEPMQLLWWLCANQARIFEEIQWELQVCPREQTVSEEPWFQRTTRSLDATFAWYKQMLTYVHLKRSLGLEITNSWFQLTTPTLTTSNSPSCRLLPRHGDPIPRQYRNTDHNALKQPNMRPLIGPLQWWSPHNCFLDNNVHHNRKAVGTAVLHVQTRIQAGKKPKESKRTCKWLNENSSWPRVLLFLLRCIIIYIYIFI